MKEPSGSVGAGRHESIHHVPVQRTASESDVSSMSRITSSQTDSSSADFWRSDIGDGYDLRSASSNSFKEAGRASAAISNSNSPNAGDGDPHVPSEGSQNHALGTCTPCFFSKFAACKKGRQCPFCHLQHAKNKTKPSKRVRDRLREATVKDLSAAQACTESMPLTAGRVNPGSEETLISAAVPRTPGPLNHGPVNPGPMTAGLPNPGPMHRGARTRQPGESRQRRLVQL